MQIRIKRILLISFVVILILASCSINTTPTNSLAEITDQIAAAETQLPTFTPVPTMTPTSAVDVSEWIVKVCEQECRLIPFGDDYPGWYMADCPEQLWFPIGQTITIELNLLDSETCPISPIDDFELMIQDKSIDAMIVEFVQMDEGGWGCQIPYSDTSGLEVICGFECGGEGIKVIFLGKTIRAYTGGSSGNGNGRGQPILPDDEKPSEGPIN